jgi:hydroxyacylglutathione hydrolase
VRQFLCLTDNYGYLVHDPLSGETAAIDTPDAAAIQTAAEAAGWRISQIWNTHWHPDHAGGNAALAAATGARVLGPAEVARAAPEPDHVVQAGERVRLGAWEAEVLDVGGHTLGHVAYVFAAARMAFVGDALFPLGCGRLFEGEPAQMWASLQRLAALDPETLVYCAHEYTEANLAFALSVDAANPALQARATEIRALRAQGLPTVPTRMDWELAANPFLRAPTLKAALGIDDDAAAFGELRRRKDAFR